MDREAWQLMVHGVTAGHNGETSTFNFLKKLTHIYCFALNSLLGSAPIDQLTQMPYCVFKFETHRELFSFPLFQ